jgi:hypothetical protein
MGHWEEVGGVASGELIEARLTLHWAAQVACAPGKQLLPPQPDFRQQSFTWDPAAGALVQGVVAAPRPFRSALQIARLALALLDDRGGTLAELALAGRTLDEAYTWLQGEIEPLLGRPLAQPLERPGEGLPAHPVGAGARFERREPAGFAEVARWFGNADRLLAEVRKENPDASPVRCWPHHFDLATLITLDAGADPESARSIGVGLSPGDAGRPEPYFYITPWPYPKDPALPALEGSGSWNTEGWLGAVLEARAIAGARDQEGEVRRFLASAITAARQLVGA